MLLEVVINHFLWHSEHALQENDLELRVKISKELQKPMVSINKEPYQVLQNWDEIIGFMMCRTHSDREVHSAGDLSDPVQLGIGSYPQDPQNQGTGRGRALKTSTKTTFTRE